MLNIMKLQRNVWTFMRRALLYSSLRRAVHVARFASSSAESAERPIQFSTSKAAKWKAKYSLENIDDSPKSQPYAVVLSVAAILIYFCILREENDIDELLKNKDAWKSVPHLEEGFLKAAIEEHSKLGADTSDLEEALANVKKQQTNSGI